ncbi:DUF4153 domain-containing protein [Flavobacterium gelatinilyticum]|uniref:DUF4153 domain-containing protein n=1 Tax=Flavobacterium gelatinilyticum TaxID=3003260 RepID=UPI00247FEC4C|nr:DUF4153 domain-containing protein [Flavobacterium gelatinilyticum]
MSRLPSLQKVLRITQKTVVRFPLETLTAICGTIFAILMINGDNSQTEHFYSKVIMSCSLCLVWFVSATLFFTAKQSSNIVRYLVSLAVAGLCTTFVFSFQERISQIEVQEFFVLNLSLHLLVSFAGFLPRNYNQEEFWEFNKHLFLRILTAGLYSIVLYGGLTLAVLAVDQLFKTNIDHKIYGYLFVAIVGLFNTIFFLSGVPETNSKEFPLQLNYPKGLKNFTQFVLLPLISIYLVILICYETKIIFTLSLPVGWVSYLVLAFAITGILSFLLVHPIANESGNLWMRTFNRWFYFLLIPLLCLLFWAILYRINLYGFTHLRYYVLLLSVWLAVVVFYFLLQKNPKIKFIPISMCIAGLFSIVGPQSADSVSKYSQLSRFENYIKSIETKKLTFEEEQELSSIVYLLNQNYGFEIMLPYADKKLDSLYKKDKDPGSTKIMQVLGLQYRSKYDRKSDLNDSFSYYYYENSSNTIVNIHGYDFIIVLYKNYGFESKNVLTIDNKKYFIKSEVQDYGQDLIINKDTIPLKINDFIKTNSNFNYNTANSDVKIEQKIVTSKYTVLLDYINANGIIKNNQRIPENYQIKVMVGIKK